MRQHKTLENITKRAHDKASEKNNWIASAKQGNWEVEYNGNTHTFKYFHWGTLVLELNGGRMDYFYGESKSDADGLNAMCYYHDVDARFTYRPVNGGFIQL